MPRFPGYRSLSDALQITVTYLPRTIIRRTRKDCLVISILQYFTLELHYAISQICILRKEAE